MSPTHGTVGVAPAGGEVRSTLVPDAFGGNTDTPEMLAGTTCYLGVNVPGALLSLGDGHARQNEGETCGVAPTTACTPSCENWPRDGSRGPIPGRKRLSVSTGRPGIIVL